MTYQFQFIRELKIRGVLEICYKIGRDGEENLIDGFLTRAQIAFALMVISFVLVLWFFGRKTNKSKK